MESMGLPVRCSLARRMKLSLEGENGKLKKVVADLSPDKAMLAFHGADVQLNNFRRKNLAPRQWPSSLLRL
jgi:hypothetical protein